jgi:glycosyltransferase involved in cell wall biosynthesis
MNAQVAVIIPNYNHAPYLRQRIDSVLAQTIQDIEVLILDDCSKDNSCEIINEYAGDSRITIHFNETNSGCVFKQWNKGLNWAKGKYVWIAESDDYSDPKFLETMVARLEQNPDIGLAFCDSWRVCDGEITRARERWFGEFVNEYQSDFQCNGREYAARQMLFINTVPNASSVVFRRSVAQKAGSADETYQLSADWLFWISLLEHSDLAYVAEPLNYYRYHAQTARHANLTNGIMIEEALRISTFVLRKFPVSIENKETITERLTSWFVETMITGRENIPSERIKRIKSLALKLNPNAMIRLWYRRSKLQWLWLGLNNKSKQLFRILNRRNPGVCRDVKAWCHKNLGSDAVPVIFAKSKIIKRNLPVFINVDSNHVFSKEAEFNNYERFVGCIPKARLIGENGFIVLPDGKFAFEYISHYEPFIRDHPIYFQRIHSIFRKKSYLSGSFFSPLGTFSNSYYHWMHDVLMQFHHVLEYLPKETLIVVPSKLSAFQKDSLIALGIDESRFSYINPNDELIVDQLYFVPPPTIMRFDDPEPMQWLRGKLHKGFGINKNRHKPFRRILVSRSRALCRRIINEKDVMNILSQYGFEIVHCEDLTLKEQGQLFSAVDVVISPHGAGLTNLLFSMPGTKVLEIFPDSLINTHYWSLSEALNHEYAYLCGKAVPNNKSEPDIFVEPAVLLKGLHSLGLRPL